MLTRLQLALEGIEKCKTATAAAVKLKGHQDPAIQELANAIHYLSFGVQEIALALTDKGRIDDLPIQSTK